MIRAHTSSIGYASAMALLAAAACSDNDLSTIGGDEPDATVMPVGSQALLWHPRIGRRRRRNSWHWPEHRHCGRRGGIAVRQIPAA